MSRSKDEKLRELLSAYLDDELSPAERVSVERAIEADDQTRKLYNELSHAKQLVASLPRAGAPDGMVDEIVSRSERQQLLGDEPEVGDDLVERRSRRAPWIAVAAAVVVTFGAGYLITLQVPSDDARRADQDTMMADVPESDLPHEQRYGATSDTFAEEEAAPEATEQDATLLAMKPKGPAAEPPTDRKLGEDFAQGPFKTERSKKGGLPKPPTDEPVQDARLDSPDDAVPGWELSTSKEAAAESGMVPPANVLNLQVACASAMQQTVLRERIQEFAVSNNLTLSDAAPLPAPVGGVSRGGGASSDQRMLVRCDASVLRQLVDMVGSQVADSQLGLAYGLVELSGQDDVSRFVELMDSSESREAGPVRRSVSETELPVSLALAGESEAELFGDDSTPGVAGEIEPARADSAVKEAPSEPMKMVFAKCAPSAPSEQETSFLRKKMGATPGASPTEAKRSAGLEQRQRGEQPFNADESVIPPDLLARSARARRLAPVEATTVEDKQTEARPTADRVARGRLVDVIIELHLPVSAAPPAE